MIDNDESGQTPEIFDNVIDNILRILCGINFHKWKKSTCNILPDTAPTNKRMSIFGVPLCYAMLQNYSYQKSIYTQDDNFSGFNIFLEKLQRNDLEFTVDWLIWTDLLRLHFFIFIGWFWHYPWIVSNIC